MANKDLRRAPHNFKNDDVWWYEEPQGICVVISNPPKQIRIPWKTIRNALKRKDKP